MIDKGYPLMFKSPLPIGEIREGRDKAPLEGGLVPSTKDGNESILPFSYEECGRGPVYVCTTKMSRTSMTTE